MKQQIKFDKSYTYFYLQYKEHEAVEVIYTKTKSQFSVKILIEYGKKLYHLTKLNNATVVKVIVENFVLERSGEIVKLDDKIFYDLQNDPNEYDETDWETYLKLKKEFEGE